jgi:hypothetical protein
VLTLCRTLLQLQNDQKFNSTFPLPTVAMDDSHVRPRRLALASR